MQNRVGKLVFQSQIMLPSALKDLLIAFQANSNDCRDCTYKLVLIVDCTYEDCTYVLIVRFTSFEMQIFQYIIFMSEEVKW